MSEGLVLDWTPDYSLKWSNFKAESNPSVYEDSHSVVKYRFTWTVNSDIVDKKIMFLIDNILLFVEFHPLLSWIRSESNAGLLLHEQGCFDLAELVKRENFTNLQDQFYHKYYPTRGQNEEQRKQFAKEDSGKMIASEIEKLQKLYDEKRKKYQEDTNFGQNFDEQSKYDLLFKQLRQ
jgi:hypothetical protein